jgi:hypothetical protein
VGEVAALGGGDKPALRSAKFGPDFGDSLEVAAGSSPPNRVMDSPPKTLQSGDERQMIT